jgi:lipid A ethanolaminephosphotransferase
MFSFINSHRTFCLVATAIFLSLGGNFAFYSKLMEVYPVALANIGFLASIALFFTLITLFVLNTLAFGKALRWVLMLVLMSSAFAAHFMDTFGAVIDVDMLNNVLQTNPGELSDLLTPTLLLRTLLLGVLPCWWIYQKAPAVAMSRASAKEQVMLGLALLPLLVLCVAPFSAQYASFVREHKSLRYYANPSFYLYSLGRLAGQQFASNETLAALVSIANDAVLNEPEDSRKELIVLVVGETARSDRFSLNGYSRLTNPELVKESVVSFKQVSSCGTATAVSLPCMFSSLGRDAYAQAKSVSSENVLDVLAREGVEVLWRDNNSDSKGVATRLRYENFQIPKNNTVCDVECRDEGMLVGLEEFIKEKAGKDILIVLHQMGNHGPAYYKRYPSAFEKFKPACKTNELSQCSTEEINNAYDNAILYTDHFLSKVVALLKQFDETHEAAMLYVSDHGESLGEYGMYLHGSPYAIAPREQTHVPVIAWVGKHFSVSAEQLKRWEKISLSHDDLFCSLILSFEVETRLCTEKLAQWSKNPPVQ